MNNNLGGRIDRGYPLLRLDGREDKERKICHLDSVLVCSLGTTWMCWIHSSCRLSLLLSLWPLFPPLPSLKRHHRDLSGLQTPGDA